MKAHNASAELLDHIVKAFPATPLPEMTLRQAQLTDQSLSREISEAEWNKEGKTDRGISWPEISAQTLAECDAALSHLDEQAFVYYLPAYLSAAVHFLSSPCSEFEGLLGDTVFAVTNRTPYNQARFKRLNSAQIDVVIAFLRMVRDAGRFDSQDARKALERYWERPDARNPSLIELP